MGRCRGGPPGHDRVAGYQHIHRLDQSGRVAQLLHLSAPTRIRDLRMRGEQGGGCITSPIQEMLAVACTYPWDLL